MRLLETMRRNYVARRHTALLIAIVGMFAVRPLMGDATAPIVFSLATLLVLLAALLTIQVDDMVGAREALLVQRRRRSLVGWALAVAAIAERLWVFLVPSSPRVVLVGAICWLLFFSFVTWSQLRSLLKQREITGETISMSILVYLLLGLTWGLLYIVIFMQHPEAFSFGTSPAVGVEHMFPIFIYFSLTTLSTIGFGDITPLTLPARYAAVAEGITGQFYLAILVARLVGLQMSRAAAAPSDPADERRIENLEGLPRIPLDRGGAG
jgi:voltage-gated potassium channel